MTRQKKICGRRENYVHRREPRFAQTESLLLLPCSLYSFSGVVSEAEVLVPDPATGLVAGDRVAIKVLTYRGASFVIAGLVKSGILVMLQFVVCLYIEWKV